MSDFLADWNKAKKDFTTGVVGELQKAGAGIPADFRQEVVALLKAETGMTPALKEVDAAFAKKYRKAVMQGLTKVHAVIEKSAMQVQRVAVRAGNKATEVTERNAQNALGEIQMIGMEFKRQITGFETRIAKELESLQEEKSPEGTKINIISLEGDMNGALAKFKSATKPHAELEKKLKVLGATDPAVRAMQAYSKAAARTQVNEALVALEAFFKGVDTLDAHGRKVAQGNPKPDPDYLKAVDSLCAAFRAIKTQRGMDSHRNLKQLEAAGTA